MFTSLRFHPVPFWKGSGTFLNAKSCIFGSIDFNGNAAEEHVVSFCYVFDAFCILNLPSNKKKKQNAAKTLPKHVQKCNAKRTAETDQTQTP
ncbi:unnamed protein product [Staurois parvus]|uniref:Uncharacterized protein n=1 Tax=Staurois parvus TaxID=386267 RepID=A0ABN9H4X7_9NEOB|nr:unnamed protein product [Staurois parvus]